MKLKKVYIEITNVCNLNCSFCAHTKREKGFIDEQSFSMVVDKIKKHTNYVYLHVLGEPLMHPKLDVLLDICLDRNIHASITTNASLLQSAGSGIKTKEAIRQINYSLHSMYSDINAGKEVLSEKLQTVFNFISSVRSGVFHCLRLWNINSENEEINDYILEAISKYFGTDSLTIPSTTQGNGIKIFENVFLQLEEQFTWPDINLPAIHDYGKCHAIKDHVGILVDGTVVPCCLDYDGFLNLGNIYEKDLEDILNSPLAHKILTGYANRSPVTNFCKTCGFLKRLNS